LEKVLAELEGRGIAPATLDKLRPVLEMQGNSPEKLDFLGGYLENSETGCEGLAELRRLFQLSASGGEALEAELEFDLTLARGLNYYTGSIFEVKSAEVQIGSICGGGRYDNLTGIFGLDGVSGVGVSFGADRIYDVLLQLDRFPGRGEMDTRLLFVNFGEKEVDFILPVLGELRKAGVASELYPDQAKMKKQMSYANARSIPFVALVGEQEVEGAYLTLKDMNSGEQEKLSPEALLQKFSS